MHYPESRFYLRRVRISSDADVLAPLRDAGYRCVSSSLFHAFSFQCGKPSSLESLATATETFTWFGRCNLWYVTCPLRLRLEPAAENPEGTVVVEVPVDAGEGVRTARDLSVWEQLSFAAFLQRYWADNQVSTF